MSGYDIVYMTMKAIKESVIVDHLADNAIKEYEPLSFDFPNEDVLTIKKEKGMINGWCTLIELWMYVVMKLQLL